MTAQHRPSHPVVLCIMDGIGIGAGDAGDAVGLAHTPFLDTLAQSPLYLELAAHGKAVGLPNESDMGNSEVGHNALGAGMVYEQGAKRVQMAIDSKEIYSSDVWDAVSTRGRGGQAVHFVGLLSDGNVHSHIEHLKSMLQRLDQEGVQRARVHVLLDGRDVGRTSAHNYIADLESLLTALQNKGRDYRIASGGGRMSITMDRYEAEWAMVERGWRLHVEGLGRQFSSAMIALETLRAENPGVGDQDLPGFVVAENGKAVGRIEDGDAVVLFNFRGDRMLELCQAFENESFQAFERGPKPEVFFCGMTLYDGDTQAPKHYLVSPPHIENTLSENLVRAGLRQFACSETQKFGHVTYFWNGNRSGYFDGKSEKYLEIPSNAPPFETAPQMMAPAITDALIEHLALGSFDFLRVNYANGDMVGHTGHLDATQRAVESVDRELHRVHQACQRLGAHLVITADHGNAEDMAERNPVGELKYNHEGHMIPKTSHSINAVPFGVLPAKNGFRLADVTHKQGLANIATTISTLLGIPRIEGHAESLLSTTK